MTPSEQQLTKQLLEDRDRLYQEVLSLKAILKEKDAKQVEIETSKTAAEEKNLYLEKKLTAVEEEKAELLSQLLWLRKKIWGRMSERYIPEDPNQRRFDFEGLDMLEEEKELAAEAAKEAAAYITVNKKVRITPKPIRKELFEGLRTEDTTIEPEGIDKENWVRIGEEVTRTLEFKPGEIYVKRIIRPKYALKKALSPADESDEKRVRIADLPMLPLPKSNAGSSLLAELLIGKYLYHLPFYRQIEMFKTLGVSLSASTINDWFFTGSDLLRALYDRLKEVVLATDYIQIDESTVPVIDNEKNKTVKAYLWLTRSVMEGTLFFHYDKGSRAQRVVVELLKNYQGAVQSDGYEAYSIYENKKDILLLGCWAHARRKFEEALAEDKAGAEYALEQIQLIYQVENMATDQKLTFEERAELRKRLAYPIICAFEKWIVSNYPKVLPKGRMGKALHYTYSIYHRLSRYHLDGRYLMDNNLAENAIRPLALGRKNYLFCGNHDAAENAAVMYSLLGCCKTAGVDAREWLIDVLNRIPTYNNDYSLDLADLLPHKWKESKSKLIQPE